jgi:hypothetical protein
MAKIILKRGRHNEPEEGCCLMEAVSLSCGEPFSDAPATTCTILAAFSRELNDCGAWLSDGERTDALMPLVEVLANTATDDIMKQSERLSILHARATAAFDIVRDEELDTMTRLFIDASIYRAGEFIASHQRPVEAAYCCAEVFDRLAMKMLERDNRFLRWKLLAAAVDALRQAAGSHA